MEAAIVQRIREELAWARSRALQARTTIESLRSQADSIEEQADYEERIAANLEALLNASESDQ